jgi:hypothetical protein
VRIKEGRNRVVRRVFEKLGHSVMKLKRTVYGPFKIGRLQVGQVRVLTAREYLQVRRKVMTFKGEESSPVEREPKMRPERRPEGRLSDWERERPRLKPSRPEGSTRARPKGSTRARPKGERGARPEGTRGEGTRGGRSKTPRRGGRSR